MNSKILENWLKNVPTQKKINEDDEKKDSSIETGISVDDLLPEQEQDVHEYESNPEDWSSEIKELEVFFNEIDLPAKPVQLDQCARINDVKKFVGTHLAMVKSNNGNKTFLPYLERLQKIKERQTHVPSAN